MEHTLQHPCHIVPNFNVHAKCFPVDISCQYRLYFFEIGMNGIMYMSERILKIKVWVQTCSELTLDDNF